MGSNQSKHATQTCWSAWWLMSLFGSHLVAGRVNERIFLIELLHACTLSLLYRDVHSIAKLAFICVTFIDAAVAQHVSRRLPWRLIIGSLHFCNSKRSAEPESDFDPFAWPRSKVQTNNKLHVGTHLRGQHAQQTRLPAQHSSLCVCESECCDPKLGLLSAEGPEGYTIYSIGGRKLLKKCVLIYLKKVKEF